VHITLQNNYGISVLRIKTKDTSCICEISDKLICITDKILKYYDIEHVNVSFDGKYIVFLKGEQIYIQNTFRYNLDKLFDVSCSDKLFLSKELEYLFWSKGGHMLVYGDNNYTTQVYNVETKITHSIDGGYSYINYKIYNNLIHVYSNCIYVYNIDDMSLIGIIKHNYSFKLWHSVLNVLLVAKSGQEKWKSYRVNVSNMKLEKIQLGYNYLRDEIYDVVMEIILSAIDLPCEIINVELYQQIMTTKLPNQIQTTFYRIRLYDVT